MVLLHLKCSFTLMQHLIPMRFLIPKIPRFERIRIEWSPRRGCSFSLFSSFQKFYNVTGIISISFLLVAFMHFEWITFYLFSTEWIFFWLWCTILVGVGVKALKLIKMVMKIWNSPALIIIIKVKNNNNIPKQNPNSSRISMCWLVGWLVGFIVG